MIIGSVRDGLVEATHPVSLAAVSSDGSVIHFSGDHERDFYARSAIKPLQAVVSIRNGADLSAEQIAVASASHVGEPAHIAIVEQMLSGAGLEPDDLVCPPDRPLSREADRLWASRGRSDPERILHNCSGKHAGLLRSCAGSGWPLDYQRPDHPAQQQIFQVVSEATRREVGPTGVDGCGLPTLRTDTVGLANAFAAVATWEEFGAIREATMRMAALTRGTGRPETVIARWFPSVVKGGAEGCIGIAWPEGGMGFAAKCWTGSDTVAAAALVHLLRTVGVIPEHPYRQLSGVVTPSILGGGRPRGTLEVVEP